MVITNKLFIRHFKINEIKSHDHTTIKNFTIHSIIDEISLRWLEDTNDLPFLIIVVTLCESVMKSYGNIGNVFRRKHLMGDGELEKEIERLIISYLIETPLLFTQLFFRSILKSKTFPLCFFVMFYSSQALPNSNHWVKVVMCQLLVALHLQLYLCLCRCR